MKTKQVIFVGVGIFIIMVVGYGCYGYGREVTKTGMAAHENATGVAQYKKSVFGGEIPSTWSEAEGGDVAVVTSSDNLYLTDPKYLYYSFSADRIGLGEGSPNQVNFYYISQNVVKELEQSASANKYPISHQIVGEASTTIIQYPTDNGEVDVMGAAGKDYIIGPYPQGEYLLMSKLGLGNSTFESDFRHFLTTANFN